MITAYATTAQAVQAMREGAYDYIQKPFKNDELLAVVEKAAEKRAIVDQNRTLRRRVQEGFRSGDVVGKSPAMQHVMRLVERVASAPTSVLITGESGTGKELIARALHHGGERARQAVRRGQLRRAARGAARERALRPREGRVHRRRRARRRASSARPTAARCSSTRSASCRSTLQVKLLRVLQERTVRPVGGHEEIAGRRARRRGHQPRPRSARSHEGRFREDLYYRLNVINLHLPPLRERPEDIPLLAEHFLDKHGAAAEQAPDASRPRRCAGCSAADYRGNVRELENVVERAVTLALGPRVELSDLDVRRRARPPGAPRWLPIEHPRTPASISTRTSPRSSGSILVAALDKAKRRAQGRRQAARHDLSLAALSPRQVRPGRRRRRRRRESEAR